MILGVPDIQRLEEGLVLARDRGRGCTLRPYFPSLKYPKDNIHSPSLAYHENGLHCQGDWLCDLIVGEVRVKSDDRFTPCPCKRLGKYPVIERVGRMLLTGRTID